MRARIILIVLVIAIIGLLVAAILGVGKNMTGTDGGSESTQPAKSEDKPLLLSDIPNEKVEVVVRGPIVADEDFRSYKITISQGARTFNLYDGYKNELDKKTELYNNSEAFTQLVHALNKNGMAKSIDGVDGDVRGICANGKLITFNVYIKGELKSSLWTSTCNGSKGNLGANASKLLNLFTAQVPDFDKLLSKTNL